MGSFSALQWLLVAGIMLFILRPFIFNTTPAQVICPNCGSRGEPKTTLRGHFAIEIVLWLCFIVPGLIYTIWRSTSRHTVCSKCRAEGVIPLNSPRGEMLARQFSAQPVAHEVTADSPAESDAEKMKRLGIEFDGTSYKFMEYKYGNLVDAIAYAERHATR